MMDNGDTIGVVRDHRWMRAAEQRRNLLPINRITITLGDAKGRDTHKTNYSVDDLVMLTRKGTVIQLMYAFLLADPSRKRLKGGMRKEFERVLDRIEKRGGIVRDVLTGLSTETKDRRRALILSVSDQIRRSSQGRSSGANGKRSKGRPKAWADPTNRQIIWEEWHSNANYTNIAAAKAASKRIGKYVSHNTMWRIVKEMREAKGLKGKGASGRRPHTAAAVLVASLGAPDERGPRPPRPKRGVVYFLKNGVRGQVKIGFTEGLKGRISSLQGAMPEDASLIGTIPGTRKTEMRMHKKFDAQRIHPRREWFRIEGELAAFLKATFRKNMRT